MRLKLGFLAQCLTAAAFGVSAHAGDVALLVVNPEYDNVPRMATAGSVLETQSSLERAGFQVVTVQGWTPSRLQAGLARAIAEMADAERVVVVVSGQTVHSSRDTWLLATNALVPEGYTIGSQGLSLGALMDAAGQARSAAVVMVTTSDAALDIGLGLESGPGRPDVPDGVTLITGPAVSLTRLLSDDLLNSGQSILDVLTQRHPGIVATGDLPNFPLFPGTTANPEVGALEDGYWRSTRRLDTLAAYQGYLQQYPRGVYAAEARSRIGQLQDAVEQGPRRDENLLGLTPAGRRAVQQNLTLLGFDTQGVDGVFGGGTRSAIARWQRANGFEGTGYLSREQVANLKITADRVRQDRDAEAANLQAEQERKDRAYWQDTGLGGGAPELRAYLRAYPRGIYADVAKQRLQRLGEGEAEGDRLLAEQERRDRAYWQDTGLGGGAPELRAYLKAFPTGIYAEVAKQRLQRLGEGEGNAAEVKERQLWTKSKSVDTVAAYRTYLSAYPKGQYAKDARKRIDAIVAADKQKEKDKEKDKQVIAAAKKEEEQVTANPVVRLMIEQRLDGLGLNPGSVDGIIDNATRSALRRYQDTRGLPVTGYANQATLSQMLSGR